MTLFDRLARWKDKAQITLEQYQGLSALVRREPFSVYLELNVLLYTGVMAYVGGLGWTIKGYFHQLGDVSILLGLSGLLAVCLVYCFMKGPPYSTAEAPSPNLIVDYALYLGCLCWSVELGYLEMRFHILAAQWDVYLLVTAFLFFGLAYRFDNRFVLSMGLSTLAGWFGVKMAHMLWVDPMAYRGCAMIYGSVVIGAGIGLRYAGMKKHFLGTYLNIGATALFAALLSGVFMAGGFLLWTVALLAACGISLAYGIGARQFIFVAYAAVYGYIGISSILVRDMDNFKLILLYFLASGVGMMTLLTHVARRFGREA